MEFIASVAVVIFFVKWTRDKLEFYVLKMTLSIALGPLFADDC